MTGIMPLLRDNKLRLTVLILLCLQNSIFTALRRYSQGILRETYSKHEVLLVGEVMKIVFSALMIYQSNSYNQSFRSHVLFLILRSKKMIMLSVIYGIMNILSYIALRNIGAGIFTICAQLKILSTAAFSTIMLGREYSWVKWRALSNLMVGVLLFSENIWNDNASFVFLSEKRNAIIGIVAVLTEVFLSGFASIYFEKVVKNSTLETWSIWERNFQLALGSFPLYFMFILGDNGGEAGFFRGWSFISFLLAMIGASGGLLVALSIKYGDSILKTLATTGSIVLSSTIDHFLMGGPLSPIMILAGIIVIISIVDYTFDPTPSLPTMLHKSSPTPSNDCDEEEKLLEVSRKL
mmetsp:Transcript_8979/g.12772  ORF Transcript_8979/g.12772 Transcript_8979/m.12772 type:complete len:351 (-) Transcript_8979:201-1253(-)